MRWLGLLLLPVWISCEPAPAPEASAGPACNYAELLDVYQRYLEPLMRDPETQSCTQCHPGNDLTQFVLETPCHTMGCMLEQQMVDLAAPTTSHVLGLTQMGANFPGSGVSGEVMQNEHDRLLAWIEYNAVCFAPACGAIADPCDAPPLPTSSASSGSSGAGGGGDGTWGACSEADVLAMFEAKVWSWAYVGVPPYAAACKGCHAPDGAHANDPNNKDAEQWLVVDAGPDKTFGTADDVPDPLAALYDMAGAPGIFDAEAPLLSQLVTKPIATKPQTQPPVPNTAESTLGTFVGVVHGGGPKINPLKPNGQAAVADFAEFLAFYAECMAP